MVLSKPSFEQGPIRPPNEANSLLLRLTRNCPWNRCLFCPVYKTKDFSRRSMEEVKADVHHIAEDKEKIKEISRQEGYGGEINRAVVARVHAGFPELLPVAFWQYHGGETVFLQDGDSLQLPADQVAEILVLLKEKFPEISRITTYARSRTILRRSVEELKTLQQAGLDRIHVGMESGSDQVLAFMKKGVTGAQHLEAGQRVKEAGLSLSEYVLLGLGGQGMWRDHAQETAKVLNGIDPHFIRFRTLAIHSNTPLAEEVRKGNFKPLHDDEVIREQALLIDNIEGITSYIYSDHILNLLEEINGRLPEEKPRLKNTLDSYLNLPNRKRELFRLGRRAGYFRTLADMDNPSLKTAVESIYQEVKSGGYSIDDYIKQLLRRFI